MTTLAEAYQHVRHLDEQVRGGAAALPLEDTAASSLEGPSLAIAYHSTLTENHADDHLYGVAHHLPPLTQAHYFAGETLAISHLNENLELGQKFMAQLYSYRSVSRAIPQQQGTATAAKQQDPSTTANMYRQAYALLKPQINRIRDLQRYFDQAAVLVANTLKTVAGEYGKDSSSTGFPSQDLLLTVARTFDLFMVLDSLKNAKASMNNDFSIYKRIWSNLKTLTGEVDDSETMEFTGIYNFLGGQNALLNKTKDLLFGRQAANAASSSSSKNNPVEDLLIDLVNMCAQMFEQRAYVRATDKHLLLKAMTFGLVLLDQPGDGADQDITKKKRLRLEKCAKIIKSNPVVPFIGDLSMTLTTFFVRTPKLASLRWDHDASDQELWRQYRLTTHIDGIRSEYINYLSTFRAFMNKYRAATANGNPSLPDSENKQVYELMARGISLLAEWTGRVIEQSAWKFAHPTNPQTNPGCPEGARLYELAVRYNYSAEEKLALVECISMIKSLAKQLLSADRFAHESIRKHIHSTAQAFARFTLKDMLASHAKKKRPSTAVIQHVHNILADNQTSARACATARTQLFYVRSFLEFTTNDRAKGMQGGFMKDKDFKDAQVGEVNAFLDKSTHFAHMLEFERTVRECSDLSDLWFKEFYLELTKEIQFPIEMSLPWILTETVLTSDGGAGAKIEWALAPLDIYNDAANKALHQLKCRFLYDELVGEANLCFDQFIFKLSQQVFSHAKIRAGTYLLDKHYQREVEARLLVSDDRFDTAHNPFTNVLAQKRFQLLGRSVSIPKLVSQHCNSYLRTSIDVAIARYEANELTHVVELERLLTNNRLAHRVLAQHLPALDDFDDIMAETDEEMSLVAFNGRIVAHTVQELINDFLPNHAYNAVTRRFVRSPVSLPAGDSRPPAPKAVPMYLDGNKHLHNAHSAVFQLYQGFFGVPHFLALARLLGVRHMDMVVGQVFPQIESLLALNLTPYVKTLVKALPHSTKLPPVEYGAVGCYDYFQVLLAPILKYAELKSGIMQSFREFGNALVFLHLMDGALREQQFMDHNVLASLVGQQSILLSERTDPKYSVQHVLAESDAALTGGGSGAAVSYRQQGEQLARLHQLYSPVRLLDTFLGKLGPIIERLRPEWESQQQLPTKDSLATDHSAEFYRLWSVVQYAYTLPVLTDSEYSNRELFGDAFVWGGAALVQLLDEQRRYQVFDFVRHLSYVASVDGRWRSALPSPSTPNAAKLDYKRLFSFITYVAQLNGEVLDYLNV